MVRRLAGAVIMIDRPLASMNSKYRPFESSFAGRAKKVEAVGGVRLDSGRRGISHLALGTGH
jgi:hypothetical protein